MSEEVEPTPPSPPETVAVTDPSGALDRAVERWSSRATREAFPRDRVFVRVRCAACSLTRGETFHCAFSPVTDARSTPLYRTVSEIGTLLTNVREGRPDFIAKEDWALAITCPCGAPTHHSAVSAASLLRAMIGSGAGLVATVHDDGALRLERWPDGARTGVTVEPTEADVERAFGRALNLFSFWEDLATRVPENVSELGEQMVVGTLVEPGVYLMAASNEAVLAAAVGLKLEGRRSLMVRLDAGSTRTPLWPALTPSLGDRLDAGAKAALVMERDAVLAQSRMWARARMGVDVIDVASDRWEIETPIGSWPVAPGAIGLAMVQFGLTMAEASAFVLSEANEQIVERIKTLERLVKHLPGASFDVTRTKVTARLPDGRAAREIEIFQLPADAASIAESELARQAAFLFDAAPSWADRLRVCSCGAAASLERKLVAWPWDGTPESTPWVLETWGDEAQPRAAEVLALCCDLHVQILAESELRRLGLEERRLRRRLSAEVGGAAQTVEVAIAAGDPGPVLIARGPFIAGTMLVDGHLATLNTLAGSPVGEAGAAFALGPDMLAVTVHSDDAEPRVHASLQRLGFPDQHPFVLTRNVDLASDPIGKFAILGDNEATGRPGLR